jgi:hypothetical protein
MLARISGAILMVTVVIGGMPAAVAEDWPIAAFAGHFSGTGVAKDEISKTFDETVRNIDVIITPDGDGFALSWATVLRKDGDADETDIKQNHHALYFEATEHASVFQSGVEVDPLAGWPFVWARIQERTLTIDSLLVHEDGSYEMQTYDRTLTDAGMELYFTRFRDGRLVRSVSGTLTRVED